MSVVELEDESILFDDQNGTLDPLGPHATPVSINSSDGSFSGNTNASVLFTDASSGSFDVSYNFNGNLTNNEPDAQQFGQTLTSTFMYDFTIPDDGDVRIEGSIVGTTSAAAVVSVFAESTAGAGFTGPFFEQLVLHSNLSVPVAFDFPVELTAGSGSYRIQIRRTHSGAFNLETDPESGSLTSTWTINAPTACPADFAPVGNPDGVLNFFDVSAFIAAFTAMDPAADFAPVGNPDGLFNFFDVSAYIAAFSAGCP